MIAITDWKDKDLKSFMRDVTDNRNTMAEPDRIIPDSLNRKQRRALEAKQRKLNGNKKANS